MEFVKFDSITNQKNYDILTSIMVNLQFGIKIYDNTNLLPREKWTLITAKSKCGDYFWARKDRGIINILDKDIEELTSQHFIKTIQKMLTKKLNNIKALYPDSIQQMIYPTKLKEFNTSYFITFDPDEFKIINDQFKKIRIYLGDIHIFVWKLRPFFKENKTNNLIINSSLIPLNLYINDKLDNESKDKELFTFNDYQNIIYDENFLDIIKEESECKIIFQHLFQSLISILIDFTNKIKINNSCHIPPYIPIPIKCNKYFIFDKTLIIDFVLTKDQQNNDVFIAGVIRANIKNFFRDLTLAKVFFAEKSILDKNTTKMIQNTSDQNTMYCYNCKGLIINYGKITYDKNTFRNITCIICTESHNKKVALIKSKQTINKIVNKGHSLGLFQNKIEDAIAKDIFISALYKHKKIFTRSRLIKYPCKLGKNYILLYKPSFDIYNILNSFDKMIKNKQKIIVTGAINCVYINKPENQ